ncbi:MAG TPA: hypothetical protein VF101_06195 [Gaiellaceae bacterium]
MARTKAGALVAALGIWPVIPACGGATQHSPPQATGSPALRIAKLTGSVVALDPKAAYAPLWLELHATVCVGSPMAAYPDGIGVTHYVVSRDRKRWWTARSAVDHAPWLVPMGEMWHGKPCGPVFVHDPIPNDHYGVESLGNPLTWYGARLTITVGRRHASRRAIIECGGLRTRGNS